MMTDKTKNNLANSVYSRNMQRIPLKSINRLASPTGDYGMQGIDARYGELGLINNPNGGHSTEYSITENIPELGGWVNIPTMVEGQVDIQGLLSGNKLTPEQFRIAARRAINRVKGGASLPSYSNLYEADLMAGLRTNFEKGLNYPNMGE